MQPITPHSHNDTDSPKLYLGDSAVSAPQEALTTGTILTAGASYGTNEQSMLNNFKARIAELETKLQTLGLLK